MRVMKLSWTSSNKVLTKKFKGSGNILKDHGQRIVVFIRKDNVTTLALIERHHDMLNPSRKRKEFILVVIVPVQPLTGFASR